MTGFYRLDKKTIILTGSNGQLGSSAVLLLKELGAFVVGVDCDEIKAGHSHVDDYYSLDLRLPENIKTVFTTIFKKYQTVECLINNAGVSTFENFEERTEKDFDWVMDVNLKGTFFSIQTFVNLFDEYKMQKGAIVNIASLYGVVSPDPRIYIDLPRKNSEIYGASKAGIIQMTKYFAVHLASRNIRVNSISPGGILNPINPQGAEFQKEYAKRCPMGRMANQEEIVAGLPFLLSNEASYVNGINLMIDGGMSCW